MPALKIYRGSFCTTTTFNPTEKISIVNKCWLKNVYCHCFNIVKQASHPFDVQVSFLGHREPWWTQTWLHWTAEQFLSYTSLGPPSPHLFFPLESRMLCLPWPHLVFLPVSTVLDLKNTSAVCLQKKPHFCIASLQPRREKSGNRSMLSAF